MFTCLPCFWLMNYQALKKMLLLVYFLWWCFAEFYKLSVEVIYSFGTPRCFFTGHWFCCLLLLMCRAIWWWSVSSTSVCCTRATTIGSIGRWRATSTQSRFWKKLVPRKCELLFSLFPDLFPGLFRVSVKFWCCMYGIHSRLTYILWSVFY